MSLQEQNNDRWSKVSINPNRDSLFASVAHRLTAPTSVTRYKEVEKRTGVPWWFVAVVHEREASQRWNANISQGDRWDRISTHVPRGRGPFKSWEDAAVDALTKCAPYAARNKDWSPGGALTMLEKYNGLGYAKRGVPSPYIWAGTNQYTRGKYISDGVYSASAVDNQLGCAGLLIKMNVFDKLVVKPEHGAVGGAVIGGAALASQWPEYVEWIILGSVLVAILAYELIKRFKGKQNGKA